MSFKVGKINRVVTENFDSEQNNKNTISKNNKKNTISKNNKKNTISKNEWQIVIYQQ